MARRGDVKAPAKYWIEAIKKEARAHIFRDPPPQGTRNCLSEAWKPRSADEIPMSTYGGDYAKTKYLMDAVGCPPPSIFQAPSMPKNSMNFLSKLKAMSGASDVMSLKKRSGRSCRVTSTRTRSMTFERVQGLHI
eukprot:gnl/MRDRNA2_/MRDRNA2_88938_c0_seq1.p1 gnl/MRDRNA2_/MRDRNA2_88938_c0~~gnl/MRDRNA2_/MRDRNA2_88938_c0_seq1.p1  ORF type:complete len:135 (-),score=23.37 gnl/MRDRNA2_/MRDRNA2_88938_c0_seq1:74-478(-)